MAKTVKIIKVVGVRFQRAGKIYYFNPGNLELAIGDNVIVETSRGIEFGYLVMGLKEIDEAELLSPLKPIVRKATADDVTRNEENKAREKEALEICRNKVAEHNLQLKLISASYIFDLTKIIFCFTAEGRVDFRDLVKELAGVFRTRIELRQVGVRDESRLIGGFGSCGRELCCASMLSDFHSVSIKMAKRQNLSLNPAKISGVCGRLMCCLKYEDYTDKDKQPPCQQQCCAAGDAPEEAEAAATQAAEITEQEQE